MLAQYYRKGNSLSQEFTYVLGGVPVTGKVHGDFTIHLTKNGSGNQSTTGITITEVDATNNAGVYSIDMSGVTSFLATTGEYTLVIFDTTDTFNRWELSILVTTTGTGESTTAPAFFQASAGDGRILSGGVPVEGATIYFRDSSGVLVTEVTTDASGLYSLNLDRTVTGYVSKSGYQQGTFTISVSGSTATGPAADVSLTAITAGTGLTASSLWSYARRQARLQSGSLADQNIKEIVNEALAYLAKRNTWRWLNRISQVKLNASYSTGTVAVTNGSTTVTLTGGVFPSWTATNGEILISDKWLTIASRDSDTQITLNIAWADDTNLTSTYEVYQDSYTISSDLYKFGEIFYGDRWAWETEPVSFTEYTRIKNDHSGTGAQAYAWTIAQGKLHLWYPPSTDDIINFSYYAKPADLTSSGDEADWDPSQLDLLHRAIDFFVAQRYGETAGGQDVNSTNKLLDLAINNAVNNEKQPISTPSPMRRGHRRHPRNLPDA